MHLDQLLMFISITLLVSASPGPVMLCCLFDASRYGLRQSCYSMLGASLGNLLLMFISALGLSFLMTQASWIFEAIKWLGAVYLIYLGLALIKNPQLSLTAKVTASNSRRLLKKSFLIAATNPKGLIYFGEKTFDLDNQTPKASLEMEEITLNNLTETFKKMEF